MEQSLTLIEQPDKLVMTALLEYLDLWVWVLCLQVVIFSVAEEYPFNFYNSRNYSRKYLGIIVGIIGE